MYSAKIGRDLVGNRTSLKKPVADKWRHEMEMNFQLKWKENWQDRSQKEAGFMWSMWHQAVATNTWRAKFNPAANADCPLCNSSVPETYLHRFYECSYSRRFWLFSFAVIHWVSKGTKNKNPTPQYCAKQCLFGRPIRLRRMGMKRIWELLRGIALWGSWILRNEFVFEGTVWSTQKVQDYIWSVIIDYGRVDWARTLKVIQTSNSPDRCQNALCSFDSVWLHDDLFCTRSGLSVKWKLVPPDVPLIFW